MNTKLAKALVPALRNQWNLKGNGLDSKDVYEELIANGVDVLDWNMGEILENFKKAGIINGPGYMNSTAARQHGGMVITMVNLELLDQLDFDE